ncbi:MAG: hypothetical protein RR942_06250 [Romboutsia sp.]
MVSTKGRNIWIIAGIIFFISAIVGFVNKSSNAWLTLLVSMIDFLIAYRENEKIKSEIKEKEESKIKDKVNKRKKKKNKTKHKK